MAAPPHVASNLAQQPRRGLALPPARSWEPERPAALGPMQPVGHLLGNPGPDQGYGLKLARHFRDRLVLAEEEELDDAVTGCVGVGLKRASMFGRAPIVHDLTVAYTVWGFLGGAPAELVAMRRPLFQAVSHHYDHQRAIADRVPAETLRMLHTQVQERFPRDWRMLLGLE